LISQSRGLGDVYKRQLLPFARIPRPLALMIMHGIIGLFAAMVVIGICLKMVFHCL
jgi:hypothetical protein